MDREENKTIKLSFLGGVSEVGGNVVLFEDYNYDVKILLDFGINMPEYSKYYSTHVNSMYPKNTQELIENKLIPNFTKKGISNFYLENFEEQNEQESSNLDGIFISHAHRDHYFGLSFINREIPVYTGVSTHRIITSLAKTKKPQVDNNFLSLNWELFRTKDVINIKGLHIVPFHVDHSVPGSYGFIIYSSAGQIVYTGDFRLHGPLANMTEEFIEEVKNKETYKQYLKEKNIAPNEYYEDTLALICEGTKISKGILESEHLVEDNLKNLFNVKIFDFALVKYDRVDWDRFRSFSTAAKDHSWNYIITEKEAYLYYLLNEKAIHETMKNPNIMDDDHIKILKSGSARYDWKMVIRQEVYKKKLGSKFIELEDLKKMQGKFFIYMPNLYDNLFEVIEYLTQSHRGVFISSSVDPYSEEMYDNTDSVRKRLKPIGIPSYRIQASGHSPPHDIIRLIETINPQNLFPIHTEYQEFFESMLKKTDIDVILLEKNDAYEF